MKERMRTLRAVRLEARPTTTSASTPRHIVDDATVDKPWTVVQPLVALWWATELAFNIGLTLIAVLQHCARTGSAAGLGPGLGLRGRCGTVQWAGCCSPFKPLLLPSLGKERMHQGKSNAGLEILVPMRGVVSVAVFLRRSLSGIGIDTILAVGAAINAAAIATALPHCCLSSHSIPNE